MCVAPASASGESGSTPAALGEKSVVQESWGINPRRSQFPLRGNAGEIVVIRPAVSGQGHAQLAEVVAARGQSGMEAAALDGRQRQRRGDEKHRRRDHRIEPAGAAAPTRRDSCWADRRPAAARRGDGLPWAKTSRRSAPPGPAKARIPQLILPPRPRSATSRRGGRGIRDDTRRPTPAALAPAPSRRLPTPQADSRAACSRAESLID